ncbi:MULTISPECIES: hypothetical protein [unclassified Streptomyces]|uniref:hypothetical protein n=1 Tax=unclassified Streptomyces TaxID=2593676 RepID=UPI00202428CB|nr:MULTISPECIES: hypothetical protein [unclassified Streptomyces]WSC22317.1 hypothetical protein OIE60_22975 [Streptomyces sp. NBC_01766]
MPADKDTVVDATQFSVAFFATLLTGEAVIFALTFSAESSWPSLHAIDSHIAFREWVFIGWVAAMFTGCGLLWKNEISATYGALLFLLANIFGVFSFIQLFGLASVGGRNRLLTATLTRGLVELRNQEISFDEQLSNDPLIAAYLGTLDQIISRNDPSGIRNLVGQLIAARVPAPANENSVALHLEVLHRLCRAALVRGADPVVVTGSAESLVRSILVQARDLPDPAAVLGATSRYLAWLGSTSMLMSVRGIASSRAARELVAMSVECRLRILLCVDPDPKTVDDPDDVASVLTDPVGVLLWVRDYSEFHGAHQANAFYGVFQFLTGRKFMGNYWDGASVLSQMRGALYGAADPASGEAPDAAREAFGSVVGFDRFWCLASVGAIATFRDARLVHPPELIRPEFTPDPQLLGAYLRTFATHRWFTTAAQARKELLVLMARADEPGSPWRQVRERTDRIPLPSPSPRAEPEKRLAAMVLAIACRLAPLASGDPATELRAFLAGLPTPVLKSTAALAARVLPVPVGITDRTETVVVGLQVLQLVGAQDPVLS